MLRLKFSHGLVKPHCRRSLLAVTEQWSIAETIKEIGRVFEIQDSIYLESEGYYLAPTIALRSFLDKKLKVVRIPKDSSSSYQGELAQVSKTPSSKTKEQAVELPVKRPRTPSESSESEVSPLKTKQSTSAAEKKAVSNRRKQMKRAPVMQEFTGKRVKFSADGGRQVLDKPNLNLNILTPADEFAQKKQSWRVPSNQQSSAKRPYHSSQPNPPKAQEIPQSYSNLSEVPIQHEAKAKPTYISENFSNESVAGSSSPSSDEQPASDKKHSGYDKPRVKRFGEYEVDKGSIIAEVYKYNLKDFEPCASTELKEGTEILFKTLELNENTLTPGLSGYKVSHR